MGKRDFSQNSASKKFCQDPHKDSQQQKKFTSHIDELAIKWQVVLALMYVVINLCSSAQQSLLGNHKFDNIQCPMDIQWKTYFLWGIMWKKKFPGKKHLLELSHLTSGWEIYLFCSQILLFQSDRCHNVKTVTLDCLYCINATKSKSQNSPNSHNFSDFSGLQNVKKSWSKSFNNTSPKKGPQSRLQ